MNILAMIRRSDPEPLEISAGLMALFWGAGLALFGSWSSGSEETNLVHVLSQQIWGTEWRQGVAFVLTGISQLVVVELQARSAVRAWVSFCASTLWATVAASFIRGAWIAGTIGTGATVYSLFCIYVGWIVYRHQRETRVRRRMSTPCPAK